MLSWGRASPPPDPLPRALRAKVNLIRILYPARRAALLGGVWEGLALPEKSISVSNAILSYDRARTICRGKHYDFSGPILPTSFVCISSK